MWRFLLPAFAMMGALLVLFAGALSNLQSLPGLSDRDVALVGDPARDACHHHRRRHPLCRRSSRRRRQRRTNRRHVTPCSVRSMISCGRTAHCRSRSPNTSRSLHSARWNGRHRQPPRTNRRRATPCSVRSTICGDKAPRCRPGSPICSDKIARCKAKLPDTDRSFRSARRKTGHLGSRRTRGA